RLRIEHTRLLERGERVRGEHLGPLVAVVPGCIAAAEDVRERAREAVVLGRANHGDLAPDVVEQRVGPREVGGLVGDVQQEVEQRELELTDGREPFHERARAVQPLDLLVRQRLAGLVMTRDGLQHLRPPGVVLEKLARQLDGVPRDAVDARERRIAHLGQEVWSVWPSSWNSVTTSSCVSSDGVSSPGGLKLQTRYATGSRASPGSRARSKHESIHAPPRFCGRAYRSV